MISKQKSRENYTRVTNILYPFSGLQHIDPKIIQKAAKRGTKVHQICEGIVSSLGEIGVDDETRGYVESFKKWWGEGRDVVSMEQRFWDDELKVTGQVDLIIRQDDGVTIYDLKTSSKPSKTWKAQGSAYAYLARKAGYDVKNTVFIHLSKYGKYPKLYSYPVDTSFFLAILVVFNHFFNKEES